MKFKVAVVQFNSKTHDPTTNLLRAAQFIRKASVKGAGVIIFPEDFITAPIWNKPGLIDKSFSYREKLIKLAKENKIDIVAGSIIEETNKGVYNTSYY